MAIFHSRSCSQIQTGLDIDQKIDVLVSANVRVLQHVEDSARVGEIVVEETRGIRVDMSELAQRLSGAIMFDGSVSRPLTSWYEPFVADNCSRGSSDTSHEKISTFWILSTTGHSTFLSTKKTKIYSSFQLRRKHPK